MEHIPVVGIVLLTVRTMPSVWGSVAWWHPYAAPSSVRGLVRAEAAYVRAIGAVPD